MNVEKAIHYTQSGPSSDMQHASRLNPNTTVNCSIRSFGMCNTNHSASDTQIQTYLSW